MTQSPADSTWAPLRQRTFRWLWLGVFVSTTGTWMQTVGAQWLLVDAPNPAALVALVQAANTLPVMLLALPGGVLADSLDRRWLLFSVQGYFFAVGILLAVLTAAGQMPPALLLAFTFALGVGVAVQLPAWGASIPELVPRGQLRAASRLDLVSVNVSRAIGPVVAGLLIAHAGGVAVVFAANAASVLLLAVAALFWRRPPPEIEDRPERFVPALRAGSRYVRHDPVVRRILLRAVMFVTPAMALWALLPVIASLRLGVGADGYGAMFGALGVGAILGASLLGRIGNRLPTNATLGAGAVAYAAALAMLVLVPSFPAALGILVLSGLSWMAVDLDPAGRSPADPAGLGPGPRHRHLRGHLHGRPNRRRTAVGTSRQPGRPGPGGAVRRRRGAGRGGRGHLPTGAGDGPSRPSTRGLLGRPPHGLCTASPPPGRSLVAVTFTVAPDRQAEFLEAMDQLRQSRRRTGATRWELYRDGEQLDRFVEMFRVASWEEHLRQHEGRLTAIDQQVEQTALAFSDPPARGDHLLPP